MGKIAFVFPGQGAQYIGMGKDITKEFHRSRLIFEEASDVLGFDVAKMIFEGDEETLKITENTQPAILTASVACLTAVLDNVVRPDFVAGLSLGEYTAHVASTTFSFGDAVGLVRKRGKFMQEAVPIGVGTMAAIMGLSREEILECCSYGSEFGVVEPANFNCPGQVVISGHVKAVERAMEKASEMGAKRSILLPVSAPFHCKLLENAGTNLQTCLEKININKMNTPVVTNVTGDIIKSESDVKELLIKQVSNPVLWEDSIVKLLELGVDTFVEVGPGKVLSGFIKKVSKNVQIFNVEDFQSFQNFNGKIKNN